MNHSFPSIVLFEDDRVHRFGGVAQLRPVWAVRSGSGILRESALAHIQGEITRWVRPHLVDWQNALHPNTKVNVPGGEWSLLINGRIWDATPLASLPFDREWISTMQEDGRPAVVAAYLKSSTQAQLLKRVSSVGFSPDAFLDLKLPDAAPSEPLQLVQTPYDLLYRQERAIPRDVSKLLSTGRVQPLTSAPKPGIWLDGVDSIFVHPSVKIGMQTFIDATEGPVIIEAGTIIEGHAYLKGPLAIGENCTLRAGVKLYGASSIGPVCKLGGEIQLSLWMGYANKQHDGYIGTSVIGSWVNIGAGTNNSDLKNTYGTIAVTLGGERIETGERHIGALLGDHTKTSIGLQLNTGTTTGIACNLFGAGFPPVSVPSFTWGGAEWLREHGLEKAIETARIAMSRRKKTFTPEIEQMFRQQFADTAHERENLKRRT